MPRRSLQPLKKELLLACSVLTLFCSLSVRAISSDVIVAKVTDCMQLTDHIYCNNANIGTKDGVELYEGYGYCCPPLSQSPECQDGSNGIECTNGPDELQGVPLYKTFWSGMTPAICNSTTYELTATSDKNFKYADKFVIQERDAVDYEACHWIISVEENKYRDDTRAFIELRFETLDNAEVHIYSGTGRNNATEFIEGNYTAPLGAPFRLPISEKMIVVAMTAHNGGAGNIAFSYQLLDESEYTWFYKPFVGKEKVAWYFTMAGVLLFPFIVLVTVVMFCVYCPCCRCCCKNNVQAEQSPKKPKLNQIEISNEKVPPSRKPPTPNSQDNVTEQHVHDSESELRMQNISEFSGDHNDFVSDNATHAVGAVGLGMAVSRIDANSSMQRSKDHKRSKTGELDSFENGDDELVDSNYQSKRHNMNALNAGKSNCKFS